MKITDGHTSARQVQAQLAGLICVLSGQPLEVSGAWGEMVSGSGEQSHVCGGRLGLGSGQHLGRGKPLCAPAGWLPRRTGPDTSGAQDAARRSLEHHGIAQLLGSSNATH